jgi:acyl-CoA synthetase (AMP-forming)/AMP-acid ligase II
VDRGSPRGAIKVNGHQVAPEPSSRRRSPPWCHAASSDPDALVAWVAERVAPYKRLREVRVIAAVQRSPAGKILRRLVL